MKRSALIALAVFMSLPVPANASVKVKGPVLVCPANSQVQSCLIVRLDVATKSLAATSEKIRPMLSSPSKFDSSHDFWAKETALLCQAVEGHHGGDKGKTEGLRCQIEAAQSREALLKSLFLK